MMHIIINHHLTMTEALVCTRKVKVKLLKQREDSTEIDKKPVITAAVEKARSIRQDKQKPEVKNDLETLAENIQPALNIMILIVKTMTEVAVHLLMWKEDIVKTEVTTVPVTRLRSSEREEQKMSILMMAVENTTDIMTKTGKTTRRLTDVVNAAVLNVLCLNLISCSMAESG